jgi:predicted hotdog family 3-hydroxylacyl-ACP dehydratase
MLGKEELCALIPHEGDMCLLDEVLSWDDKNISCQTRSHLDANNPLRSENQLPISALIEYGAQAMAIHGGLLARESGETMQSGYLAALREVKLAEGDVSQFEMPLSIQATQQMASQGNMIYQFMVKAGEQELVSGRATVVAVFENSQE